MSTNGVPRTQTWGSATVAAIRASLLPGTRWSTSTPRRRVGPGPNPATTAPRWSMPSRISTTIPSMRRSSPQTFSSSSASCVPSTRMRLARATRAAAPATRRDPEAVRAPCWHAPAPQVGIVALDRCRRRDQVHGAPVDREVARPDREGPLEPGRAPQRDPIRGERGHAAGEARGPVQHQQARPGGHGRVLRGEPGRSVDRATEDPAGGVMAPHGRATVPAADRPVGDRDGRLRPCSSTRSQTSPAPWAPSSV